MFKDIESIIVPEAPKNINELLEEFKQKEQPIGERLKFRGIGSKDVYNTTAPFEYYRKRYLVGRVESPEKETDSQSIFFMEEEGIWSSVEDIPALDLQDPFVIQINGEPILGGVEIYPRKETPENPGKLGWVTVFYRGTDPVNIKEFAKGPEFMKDIRLIELPDGKIGVFTRPGSIQTRSKDGVGGMIGYTEIDSLEDLTIENINKAEIIDGLITENEWAGANELYLLENGCIGVLGHIARFNEKGDKEYYVMTFEFDPQAKKVSNKKIVATRENFPKGKTKMNENNKNDDFLNNIVYPGGMIVKPDNIAELYVGLSDAEAGKISIEYPFSSPVKTTL